MYSQLLIKAATDARNHAYAPYSRFAVGAAILGSKNEIYTGCNVESISFGLTICAERAAVFAAVNAGCREFLAIAIVADSKEPITPCGACRQVLAEFQPELRILSATLKGNVLESSLGVLLPRPKAGILNP